MKKNTVLLAVKKYNELRDFKQKIEESKTLVIVSGYNFLEKEFISTEEAVEKIAEANKILQKENKDLRSDNLRGITINDIKKMSYWEFRKWRKS